MTPRQVFDRVRPHLLAHLLAQGRRSQADQADGGTCRYRIRGEDGAELSCAIGCLFGGLPDEDVQGAESASVSSLSIVDGSWKGFDERRPQAPTTHLADLLNRVEVPVSNGMHALLTRLQMLHDRRPPGSWAEGLAKIESDCADVLDPRWTP